MKDYQTVFSELGISFEVFDHAPFFTCDDADDWYEQNLSNTASSKNIFLRDKAGKKHFLVVIESHKKLDIKALGEKLAEKKLSFASPDRLKKFLNVAPGAVSPLALLYENATDVIVIFDQDLLAKDSACFHPPGRNDQSVVIPVADIQTFLAYLSNEVQFETL